MRPFLSQSPADSVPSLAETVEGWIADPTALIPTLLLLVIGAPTVLVLSRWTRNWVTHKSTEQRGLIIGRIITYTGMLILIVIVLVQLGFRLTPLLGAAGILGIALGFASQTSVSNLISGFFIMGEQSFVVGDVIEVGSRTGIVLSIDMLSVKLRTFDNKLVRIPNETLIKSEVLTITRFPIRRIDVLLRVGYHEDIDRIRDLLREIARSTPGVLVEPDPVFIFRGFSESAMEVQLGAWTTRQRWLEVKNALHIAIKQGFDEAGVVFPFPQRTVHHHPGTPPPPAGGEWSDDGDDDGAPPDEGVEGAPPPL